MTDRLTQTPRVLCLPEDHDYVRQALPTGSIIHGASFPSEPVTARQARGWDRHPAFGAGWLDRHADAIDLVHLHFGFDSLTLPELRRWLADLRRLEMPLVLTVHDLRNPHHDSPKAHDAQLELLLAAAAEVITLTDGAAAEIRRRSRRRARVISHPRVLTDPPQRIDGPTVVGIVVKPRAQVVDPDRVVAAVVRAASRHGARVRVDAHPGSVPRLARTFEAAADGGLDLHVRERFSGDEFTAYLAGLTVSVLPYRFGTHSGWLEACRDAGTRVVAPDCGYYAEQWDEVTSYVHNERVGLDADSLTAAVTTALLGRRLAPADPDGRARAADESVRRHRDIWLDVLAQASDRRAA